MVGLARTATGGAVGSNAATMVASGGTRFASFSPQTIAVATTITTRTKSRIRTVADRRRVAATNGPGRSISLTNATQGRARRSSS
jgi:hypothetical protein